jgi:phosphatidylinositol alpha-1,6-mannosyltransferase
VLKTLVVSEVFPPRVGGSGRYLWEIYSRLPREALVLAAGEHPRQAAFDPTHDLPVRRLPLTFPTWGLLSKAGLGCYWRAARQLRRWAKAERVARVHAGKCLPEGLLAWMLKQRCGLPYACYIYGEEMSIAALSRELGWLTRRVIGGAEFVIAISRNTECILRDEWHFPPERIRLLYPGVDTSWYVPAERDPEERARLGWGPRPVVLSVGRLQKRKGNDTMIRALGVLRRQFPDVLYAIVGDGEERPALEGLVEREGLGSHVQFLGELPEERTLRCYQQCDLFVLPNRQVGRDIEGFGMVLLEAQACARPVVAGASGGTAETLRDLETGRVVCCDRPDELAAVVAELLADPAGRARMGAAGRQWAVEHFDWTALGQQARQLFGCADRPVVSHSPWNSAIVGSSPLTVQQAGDGRTACLDGS